MSSTDCTDYSSSSSKALVGWVLESPGRGSLELIRTCLFTTLLCTWVVIHKRVYKRELLSRLHKVALFLKTVIAPEFIAVEGLQEWNQAKNMVKDCTALTGGGLKLIHAFYIGMLALRYRTPYGEKILWPNQYTWLLQQGLVQWKDHAAWGLSEGNIRDKSDADGFVKLVALSQVTWFVAQSVIRTANKLPLSQLETMTLSYIPQFTAAYFFWWVKPKDVSTPSVVNLPDMLPEQKTVFELMAVNDAFDDDAISSRNLLWHTWALTPRVFEKEAEVRSRGDVATEASQTASREFKNFMNYYQPFNSVELTTPSQETVVAHWDPELYRSKLWPVTCVFGISFGALHLISWDSVFPSLFELWLWRTSALVSIISMLVFMHFEKVVLRWGGPLTMLSLVSPVLYLISRISMLVGVFAALRASDPKVYETIVVSNYWIHLF